MKNEEKKVKIKDKRKFDTDGNLKDDAAVKGSANKAKDKERKKEKNISSQEVEDQDKDKERSFLPDSMKDTEINFLQFIVTLYSSAMINLGVIPDPVSEETHSNPKQAKELIDIIAMLKEKTKGNLNDEEDKALDEIIYQARMIYLKTIDELKA